ncbi:adenosylmethionine decarboxylase [Prauserella muralis]|uniref:S-adenosylmethionine decarboxylase proenzyme n=1 Tax=Prauserella muralis TaxID=588067 RepID=A0A2V4B3V6_9PSEU|nr:adenosylmethionine decarboxylase [Prauserella muralis]PXY28068.1 S-adenosylmethionine decarboxylase proenzyme [Prauserella muralis]TWE22133.1 S-adenosylmethionine decarboxylase [Prauserella muralis]
MPSEFVPVGAFSGRHVLAELDGVDPNLLDDADFLRATLASTLTAAGATVCDVIAHQFEPQGVTVLAMLAESHASIHTYPELGTTFVDVFTCGERADPQQAVHLLADALGTDSVTMSVVQRGRQPAGAGK